MVLTAKDCIKTNGTAIGYICNIKKQVGFAWSYNNMGMALISRLQLALAFASTLHPEL